MSDLKTGDVVQLKSGGPRMTVQSTHLGAKKDLVSCVWFEGATAHEKAFKAAAVEVAPAHGGGEFQRVVRANTSR